MINLLNAFVVLASIGLGYVFGYEVGIHKGVSAGLAVGLKSRKAGK